MSPIRPWPYAALANIEYVWVVTQLAMYVVFPHPMDQDLKPAHNLWECRVDGNVKPIVTSFWNDAFTLRLIIDNVLAQPTTVLLKYLGPDHNLQTTWGKDWEPWGYIRCYYVHELTTITLTAGTHANPNVAGVKVVFLNCTAGNLLVRGFSSGVNGQELGIVRTDQAANDATMFHNHPFTTQKLYLHAMASETLNDEFGGWHFVCNGTHWYDVSHSKHV